MTTHFSNGVTNVRGKANGTSLFSGIKQPLITGGTSPQEFAYQNDFQTYNASDWQTVTSTGASDYQLADYAFGWLRQGDGAPSAGEIQGVADYECFQYSSHILPVCVQTPKIQCLHFSAWTPSTRPGYHIRV